MNDSKVTTSSRYNRTNAHMNSQSCDNMHKKGAGSNQIKTVALRRSRYKVPHHTEKLFTTDTSWAREN